MDQAVQYVMDQAVLNMMDQADFALKGYLLDLAIELKFTGFLQQAEYIPTKIFFFI